MNTKILRQKSEKELKEMLEDLKFQQIKASSLFGKSQMKGERNKPTGKGMAGQGERTKLQKDIRRNIALILTIKRERELGIKNEK